MAVREIKTRLSIDGERQFKAALSDAQREMRTLNSEMKVAKAEFDRTGDAETLLKNKTSILNAQIKQQTQIVQALEKAVDDAASAYGTADRRTDGYRIQLNNARAALVKLETQLDDTNREMTDMGRDARKIGRQIESGLGDAADDTRKKLEDMYDAIGRDIGDIRGSVQISAAIDIAQGVASVASSVGGMIENVVQGAFDLAAETYEERFGDTILRINGQQQGYTDEEVDELRKRVLVYTNDPDAAYEGIANLFMADLGREATQALTDAFIAAQLKEPETIRFENLAESFQESTATGELTGQFSEWLGRMGTDIETFSETFNSATTQGARALLLMKEMQRVGAFGALETYRQDESFRELEEEQTANVEFNEAIKETGEDAAKYVVTPVKKTMTGLLEGWNGVVDEIEKNGGVTDTIAHWFDRSESTADELEPVEIPGWEINAFEKEWEANAEIIRGSAVEMEEAGKEAAEGAKKGFFETLSFWFDRSESTADELPKVQVPGMELEAIQAQMDSATQAISESAPEFESAANEAMSGATKGVEDAGIDAISGASSAGISASQAMAQGIADGTPAAVGAAAAMADGIIAEFNRVSAASAALTLPAGGTATGGGGNINVTLNADGRNLAKVSAPYLNTMLVN